MSGRAILVVAAVSAAALVPMVAQAQKLNLDGGWDVILNYDINEDNTDVTGYSVDGDLTDLIQCDGSWSLVTNTSGSTSHDNFLQYAMDYDLGLFGYWRANNGTEVQKEAACSSFTLDDASTSSGDWVTEVDCNGDFDFVGFADTDIRTSPIRTDAVNDQPGDPKPGFCVEARAGSVNRDVPYTGEVVVKFLQNDGSLLDGVTVETVGGRFWQSSNDPDGDPNLDCPCDLTAGSDGPTTVPLGPGAGDFQGFLYD